VKLSRWLMGTALRSSMTVSTRLIFKNAAIQPVGWSAFGRRLDASLLTGGWFLSAATDAS
jgi:hypothetical protein